MPAHQPAQPGERAFRPGQRHGDLDLGARAGSRGDAAPAAEQPRALVEAREPQPAGLLRYGGIEAGAVVHHRQAGVAGGGPQRDLHGPGRRRGGRCSRGPPGRCDRGRGRCPAGQGARLPSRGRLSRTGRPCRRSTSPQWSRRASARPLRSRIAGWRSWLRRRRSSASSARLRRRHPARAAGGRPPGTAGAPPGARCPGRPAAGRDRRGSPGRSAAAPPPRRRPAGRTVQTGIDAGAMSHHGPPGWAA